jgi:uncharacterized protein (TIGR02001 family)
MGRHFNKARKTAKDYVISIIFSILSLSLASPMVAQGDDGSKFSGTAIYATDYIWHGYSKSDGNGVFQANLDYQHSSGIFVGAWVSQVDFGDDQFFSNASKVEFIPYLGYSFTLPEDWHGDVHWRRYIYNGDFFGEPGDYNEFTGSISFRDLLSASIGITDDGYGRGGIYADYELLGQYPITDLIDFSIKVGYVQSREALKFDYLYWDAGLTFKYQFVGLDFRYFNSSRLNTKNELQGGFEAIEPTFVFSVSLGF